MLSQVARFELRYQLTSPIFWITSLIFLVMTYTLAISDDLRIGWGGYVARNAPYATATMCMIMAIFAIFIVVAFVSNVILRDDESGFGPIIRSTRLCHSLFHRANDRVLHARPALVGGRALHRFCDCGFEAARLAEMTPRIVNP